MPTTIRRNERSWAIELISHINAFAENNDLAIKRAGGESTISTHRGSSMFPDVLLYANQEQSSILQGWELKMPDVPIEDDAFIRDAQRKALALGLNSFLIWNFTYAVLYVRNENGEFDAVKQWSDTSYIRERSDVEKYRKDWEKLLDEVILTVNDFFISGMLRKAEIGDFLSSNAISTIIARNKATIADELKSYAFRNSVASAFIADWWSSIHSEYEYDENDPYKAYAKTVILNWTNRILFAHLIKARQNGALCIDEISETTTPSDANEIFRRITARCDFYNVFAALEYNEIIPESAWVDFIELSDFLKSNGIDHMSQTALQSILERSVSSAKRVINGQFTTPQSLAEILVRITVIDWSENFLDCCCGTGTISKAAIKQKRRMMSASQAVETVWACDKNAYPLQVANISMTDSETINTANRLFKHNALSLDVGEEISIINPVNGETMRIPLPQFGSIAANLPFVEFERIPDDDKALICFVDGADQLDGRSDLYHYILLKIADVMKPGARLGIITSNSWLGTKAGKMLFNALCQKYDLLQVHISGKGRWFHNADVVTTITVLQKKSGADAPNLNFFLWNKSLSELSDKPEDANTLVNSALLGREIDSNIVSLSSYSLQMVCQLLSYGLSLNALFHGVGWLSSVFSKLIRVESVFKVFRGSRRGWDAMFYPKDGEHQIEPRFLQRVLINARNVNTLITSANDTAFCCNLSMDELKEAGCTGAIEWIRKFENQRNGVGRPLPEVLRKSNMYWYELQTAEIAEVFTTMNPDQRLFFSSFEEPSFVNQRLIGLCHKCSYPDRELNHALLNSVITLFYIEASGFGRGLGVLDINKDNIANCYMPNPELVSPEDRDSIIKRFEVIKARQIMSIREELSSSDRIAFENAVLHAFGIDEYFEDIKNSLLSMQRTRAAVQQRG